MGVSRHRPPSPPSGGSHSAPFVAGQTPEQRVNYLMNLMDTNKDGKISFEEFKAGVAKDPEIGEGIKSCVFRVI